VKVILGLTAVLLAAVSAALGLAVLQDEAPEVLAPYAGEPVEHTRSITVDVTPNAVANERERVAASTDDEPRAGRASLGIAELSAQLEECARDPSVVPHRYRDLLQRLVDIGTEESIGIVIDYLERPVFDSTHRASTFFNLLADVDDERIYPAAKAVLDRNLSEGRVLWPETYGYLNLMATSGGPLAAGELLRLMRDERGQVAHGAMQAVGRLRDHSLADSFLDEIATSDKPSLRRELAMGLAAWQEPGVTASLERLAFDGTLDFETRRVLGRAIARNLERDDVDPFLERYWSAASENDRTLVVASLGSIGRESGVHPRELVEVVTPVLTDALSATSPAIWRSAVAAVGDHREYHTPRVKAALEALFVSLANDSERRQVERALERVQHTLDG